MALKQIDDMASSKQSKDEDLQDWEIVDIMGTSKPEKQHAAECAAAEKRHIELKKLFEERFTILKTQGEEHEK